MIGGIVLGARRSTSIKRPSRSVNPGRDTAATALKINQLLPKFDLKELGNLLNELNYAVGVTPFVVVP